jgi:hypothetical protein
MMNGERNKSGPGLGTGATSDKSQSSRNARTLANGRDATLMMQERNLD